jgi:sugar lactone lactonase YvrE
MSELRDPRSAFLVGALLAVAFVSNLVGADNSAGSLGLFSNQSDVGSVSRPVAAVYDAAAGKYTIGASGANIWGTEDAFGFVWKQISGDIAIAADIAFVNLSNQGHRKGGLMFRQSLEQGSAYVDVAVHGDGHASLQFRSDTGGPTRTIQCPVTAPKRVRLEKRGPYVTLSIAGADGMFTPSGCSIRLSFDGPFYVGLAVCAHDNAAFETVAFSAVELGAPPPPSTARTSALEVITLSSLDRRVVYRAGSKTESPHFSPDGTELYFNRDGKIHRLKVGITETPVVIDTGFATRCINDHGLSPDGTQLVISNLTDKGKSLMYLVPVGGGTPKLVNAPEPAYWHGWSPDGQTLTYCAARNGEYDIYTIPVSGGKETRLTTTAGTENGPDYSADGRWIYFYADRTGRIQIWRMHPDGSNQEQVTNDDYDNRFPHPSPDGRWIVFLSTKVPPVHGDPAYGDYLLRLIPAAGGAPREIARFFGGNGSLNVPCWSRDSSRIAFASFEPLP